MKNSIFNPANVIITLFSLILVFVLVYGDMNA